MTHIDTQLPCGYCGKPFDRVARRGDGNSPLYKHVTQCRKNPDRQEYRPEPEGFISLHAIYCPCERCITVRQKECEERNEITEDQD